MYKILVIDDEIENVKLIQKYGEHFGYSIDYLTDPGLACDHLRQQQYDIILLDVMMPNISGYELIADIQQITDCKIFFLSALSETSDRIKGLKLGSNDYITKPFSLEELFLKIDICLQPLTKPQTNTVSAIQFDHINHSVQIGDRSLQLTVTLYKLLFELASHNGTCLSREYLLETVWQIRSTDYNRTVDTHILKLRNALGKDSHKIVTVIREGYMYED